MKTCNNWQAQLAALALSVQRGHFATLLPSSVCWSCCTGFVTNMRAGMSNQSASDVPDVITKENRTTMPLWSGVPRSFAHIAETYDLDEDESLWFKSANTNITQPSMTNEIDESSNETTHLSRPATRAHEQSQNDPRGSLAWSQKSSKNVVYIM